MSVQNKYSWFIFLTLILCYSPVLFTNSVVNPDAQIIVPHLMSISGPVDYLERLISFRTIDIQPVRDLSFFVDILIFKYSQINTLTFFNLILWWGGCLILGKIILKLFADLTEEKIFWLLLCFSVYPLFGPSVEWGMARKHLLCFYFILLATNAWMENKKISIVYYILSVLSQPISLLWPIWAYFYLKDKKKIIPYLVFMITFIVINFFYYEQSPVFKQLFGTKTNELFDVPEKILALGHYAFQILFPYLLSINYELGHWSDLAALPISVILISFLWKKTSDKTFLLSWSLFLFLPIAIIITKASFLYDTYLLIPASGIFIILIKTFHPQISCGKNTFALISLVWAGLTFAGALEWRDEVKITENNFFRRPGCKTAFQHARTAYENGVRPSPEAKKYLRDFECSNLRISPLHLINMEASTIYYEEEASPELRIEKLEQLSKFGIYPQLLLAAEFLRMGDKDKATDVLDEIYEHWGSTRFKEEYIPIVSEILFPFCKIENNQKCLNVLRPFKEKRKGLSYR